MTYSLWIFNIALKIHHWFLDGWPTFPQQTPAFSIVFSGEFPITFPSQAGSRGRARWRRLPRTPSLRPEEWARWRSGHLEKTCGEVNRWTSVNPWDFCLLMFFLCFFHGICLMCFFSFFDGFFPCVLSQWDGMMISLLGCSLGWEWWMINGW